jgi:hypothetical protein
MLILLAFHSFLLLVTHTSLTVLNIPKGTVFKLLLDQNGFYAVMIELIYVSKAHETSQ